MKHRIWRKTAYQSTSLLAVVVLILILFVSVAYFFSIPDPASPPRQTELLAELDANRALWDENRPLAYRYVVDRNCFCEPLYTKPYVATEQLGHRRATYPIDEQPLSADLAATPQSPNWIDDFFGVIEEAIFDSGLVEVSYDARFGFPNKIIISYPTPDSGRQIYVRDFEVVEYKKRLSGGET